MALKLCTEFIFFFGNIGCYQHTKDKMPTTLKLLSTMSIGLSPINNYHQLHVENVFFLICISISSYRRGASHLTSNRIHWSCCCCPYYYWRLLLLLSSSDYFRLGSQLMFLQHPIVLICLVHRCPFCRIVNFHRAMQTHHLNFFLKRQRELNLNHLLAWT